MHAELKSTLNMIKDLRRQVHDLVADLPAEALNWRPLEGTGEYATNSLGVLATHVAGAEHFWIAEVVGGRPPSRDRDAEFHCRVADSSELVRLLEATGRETQEVVGSLDYADLAQARQVRGRRVPVRWCLLHVIDHTALHLGHMQLTYQLWAGGRSRQPPRWFERLENAD